jgi:hypothetical protein
MGQSPKRTPGPAIDGRHTCSRPSQTLFMYALRNTGGDELAGHLREAAGEGGEALR